MKNILLLGGTGTIGQHLQERFKGNNNFDIYVTTRQNKNDDINVHYIQGNAHDLIFLNDLLGENHYDAIVDFMSYKTDEFANRVSTLLTATNHYVFISSCRVYGDSDTEKLKEDSPRLLDCSNDEIYLRSDEYALTKAKQENLLFSAKNKNWTIVRPYITFGSDRLQLGIYEKELWLFRALQGKPIVFPREIADKQTTLTPNREVGAFLYNLITKTHPSGLIYHITGEESMRWRDVIDVYRESIKSNTGIEVRVVFTDKPIIQPGSYYQYKYDRCYNRSFDNSRVREVYNGIEEGGAKRGLSECVRAFIKENKKFKQISWRLEGEMDRVSRSFQPLHTIPTLKNRILYLLYRLIPLSVTI